jgi:hypothetical protein
MFVKNNLIDVKAARFRVIGGVPLGANACNAGGNLKIFSQSSSPA